MKLATMFTLSLSALNVFRHTLVELIAEIRCPVGGARCSLQRITGLQDYRNTTQVRTAPNHSRRHDHGEIVARKSACRS